MELDQSHGERVLMEMMAEPWGEGEFELEGVTDDA
jgi:hypothetical protein